MNNKLISILKVSGLAVCIFFNWSTTVGASGIQVSPSKIDLSVVANRATTAELTVANPTSEVQLYRVYAEEFSENILPNPTSFTLEAGERQRVRIEIKFAPADASSMYETSIAITGKSLGGENFLTAAGVKIPITIRLGKEASVKKNHSGNYFFTGIVLLLLFLLVLKKFFKLQ